MVGGMNDLCELINIWNFEINFREGGCHLGFWSWLLEVVLLENNAYLH